MASCAHDLAVAFKCPHEVTGTAPRCAKMERVSSLSVVLGAIFFACWFVQVVDIDDSWVVDERPCVGGYVQSIYTAGMYSARVYVQCAWS